MDDPRRRWREGNPGVMGEGPDEGRNSAWVGRPPCRRYGWGGPLLWLWMRLLNGIRPDDDDDDPWAGAELDDAEVEEDASW